MSKLAKVLLLTFIVIISSLSINAGEGDNKITGSSTPTHKARLERVSNPNRKRAPSRDFIDCEYTGYGIVLYPSVDISMLEVSITGVDNAISIADIASEDNSFYLETGAIQGIFEIHCAADSGILEI